MSLDQAIFMIGDRPIGPKHPPYCIAEVGVNHNGDIDIAKRMVRAAKEANADAVKFQTFKAAEFCGDKSQIFTYTSRGKIVNEPMLEMFQRYEFNSDQWKEIKQYCDFNDIKFLSTPQNRSDLDLLIELGVSAIKVGSDDLTNLPLLKDYSSAKLPMILSCGMADMGEVHQALEFAGFYNQNPVALLLCTSQYPTPIQDVNLRKISTLRSAYPGLVVGFSDHTQGQLSASVSVALGASIFEKHFTLSHDYSGPDHWFSEEPADLKLWVNSINNAYLAMGSGLVLPTNSEIDMRLIARRSIVALNEISPGEVINSSNVGLRRPGGGLPPILITDIYGLHAAKKITAGSRLTLRDFCI